VAWEIRDKDGIGLVEMNKLNKDLDTYKEECITQERICEHSCV
jgi:hypothetical protein